MNKKIIFSVMLVGLLVFVTVMAFSQNNSTVRWEYTSLTVKYTIFEEEANKLGAQGWELVSVGGIGITNTPTYLFKRRLP